MTIELKDWLVSHSISSKTAGGELIFSHPTGHTSILLLREDCTCGILKPKSEYLQTFYRNFLGASIGDGHIIVGTPIMGGVEISQDFHIPDLQEMANQSKQLGMPIPDSREVFMMEASWMFLYAIDQTPTGETLLRYDRDFRRVEVMPGIESLLEDWWKMTEAEL